ESSNNGKEKTDFAVKTVFLAIPKNGGIPKELIVGFERYRQRYKYYGVKGRMYSLEGKEDEIIAFDYYIAPIFGVLDPNSKNVLDAIYEAKEKEMFQWVKNKDYTYAYLSTAEGYI